MFKVIINSEGVNRLIDLSSEAREHQKNSLVNMWISQIKAPGVIIAFAFNSTRIKGSAFALRGLGQGHGAEKYTAPRQSDAQEFASRDRVLRMEQDAIYRSGLFAAEIGNPLFKRVHFDTCTRPIAPEINCDAFARFFAWTAQKIGPNTCVTITSFWALERLRQVRIFQSQSQYHFSVDGGV